MTDHRGTTLSIGARVAYNLSGEIALGKILSIKESKTANVYFTPKYNIKIENIYPRNGHISTVTRTKNVLVLLEGEV